TAAVVDRRHVASSNGERENRYVISTQLSIGSRAWPIEVTLTNRHTMSYRMLLGRQAIGDNILVDPASSFRQPRLRYTLYTEPNPGALRPNAHGPRVEWAEALIQCNSVTPAEGGALTLLESKLRPAGFSCHRLTMTEPGTPDVENLYARLGTGAPHLCFA